MNNLEKQHNSIFENIKKIDENGMEYWSAREMAKVLEYADYRNFEKVIEKAKEACENSRQKIDDHFVDFTEMVEIGSGAKRKLESVKLSRYACYLIVQNADKDAGVIEPKDYAIFQNHGYRGLYGGLDAKAIHAKKGLKKSQKILDHMGSTELAANLFRATQTEEKLRREQIVGKQKANKTHYEVGVKVRKTIEELGGTMPEELPVAESIKSLEKKEYTKLKDSDEAK